MPSTSLTPSQVMLSLSPMIPRTSGEGRADSAPAARPLRDRPPPHLAAILRSDALAAPVAAARGAEGLMTVPPPTQPAAEPTLPVRPAEPPRAELRRDLGAALVRTALAAAWTARHPREPYAHEPRPSEADRYYYRAEDGWESPLWRLPPRPGASGEPVLLAHGLGVGARSFDYNPETSLAVRLQQQGYDVYLLEHRGDRHSVAPAGSSSFDFDDIAAQDVPAALATVRRVSGFPRALWVGHALGGLLMYAHLARGGAAELAAGVALCAPVRFDTPRSRARLAGLAAHLLPAGWSVPLRAVQRALSAIADPAMLASVGQDLDGPTVRGQMLHSAEDVATGLVRQLATWVGGGAFCDRDDRLDYIAALRGLDFPMLCVAAEGDRICPPEAARPAAEALGPHGQWRALDAG